MNLLERWMDRFRGTRGVLGWLVLQSDKRWLRRLMRAVKETP